jgi:hypothetical protein
MPTTAQAFAERVGAKADPERIKSLQSELAAANKSLATAGANMQRLSKIQFDLSGRIGKLNQELRVLRINCYEAIAAEHPANYEAYRQKIHEQEEARNDLVKAMSYVVSFALAQAELDQALANQAEREVTAKLFHAQALERRSAALEAAHALKKLDDGIVLNFTEAASEGLLKQAARAQHDADNYKAQASKLRADMAAEQDLIAGGLFNG